MLLDCFFMCMEGEGRVCERGWVWVGRYIYIYIYEQCLCCGSNPQKVRRLEIGRYSCVDGDSSVMCVSE